MKRSSVIMIFVIGCSCFLQADEPKTNSSPQYAGPTSSGYRLPNGWHITPVGKQVSVSDLPLNIIPLKDNRHALVATSGFNAHQLALIDYAFGRIIASEVTRQTWFGLAMNEAENQVWLSGGGSGELHSFDLRNQQIVRTSNAEIPPASRTPGMPRPINEERPKRPFKSGILLDEDRNILYSLEINRGELSAIDLPIRIASEKGSNQPNSRSTILGGKPYDIAKSQSGLLYVSDWAGRQLIVIDANEMRVVGKIPVGEHPNQIVTHPRDNRLFVACASSNGVWVIDTQRGIVTEIISTSLFPNAPEGSTPDALAVSPDGNTLYVANADNNCIAVIDIAVPSSSSIKGFIPTGWYPTALSVSPDGKNLLIGVGKGNQPMANPIIDNPPRTDGETESRRGIPFTFIGATLHGSLTILPIPDVVLLKEYTAMVYRNCPYSDSQLTQAPHSEVTAIPTAVGAPSPIKYVIYIIKENRTYDQVFGDLATGAHKKGNGDPTLCMFPRKVTPNHHKLAEEFVLLDNLYCNGQVSRDGHPWSTMAYHTDYIARDWHLTYSARSGVEDDDEGSLSNAPSGYLWDACARAGVSYRNYGEYGKRVSDGEGSFKMEGRVPGLVGHMCPNYGISKKPDGKVRDTENASVFIEEYDSLSTANQMPRFIMMSLGEDHTTGTRPGGFTPQACVASNDLALGQIVEHVSKGPHWAETAIFVIEDDAQNGPDHIDAHRTVGFVISPYTKRKFIDSTQYSTVSMIRTMELILGLPPLSQYDAAARPMFNSFTDKADLTPYTLASPEIDLNAVNSSTAYGAMRSMDMDFSEYDQIDDFELNEILWKSIMGEDAPIPPAVRQAIAFRSLSAASTQP
jgi:YVTN family beta-propeller protein